MLVLKSSTLSLDNVSTASARHSWRAKAVRAVEAVDKAEAS